jgi:hypothetical protein
VTSARWQRVVVRVIAGLALLLMLAAPVSVGVALFTWEFRWLLLGFWLGLAGFGLGLLIRETGRKVMR